MTSRFDLSLGTDELFSFIPLERNNNSDGGEYYIEATAETTISCYLASTSKPKTRNGCQKDSEGRIKNHNWIKFFSDFDEKLPSKSNNLFLNFM